MYAGNRPASQMLSTPVSNATSTSVFIEAALIRGAEHVGEEVLAVCGRGACSPRRIFLRFWLRIRSLLSPCRRWLTWSRQALLTVDSVEMIAK